MKSQFKKGMQVKINNLREDNESLTGHTGTVVEVMDGRNDDCVCVKMSAGGQYHKAGVILAFSNDEIARIV